MLFLDTKKFTLIVSALTAVVCIMTIVYNFASMPAYGNGEISAEPIYNTVSGSQSASLSSHEAESVASSKTGASYSSTSKSSKTSGTASSKNVPAKAVNINTASIEELESVPYLGSVKAQAIIDYRNSHGAFKSIDELENVKGIGTKTINKIRQYLTT